MKARHIFILFILMLAIATSCRKIENDPQPVQNPGMNELVIPADFDWASFNDIKINIGVETTQGTAALSKISVFTDAPASGGKLLVSGSASDASAFTSSLRLPAKAETIYVKCEFPFGSSKTEQLQVEKLINYTFSNAKSGNLKTGFKSTNEIGPDCDDCDLEISGNGSYTIGNGQTVCVTDNFTGSISFESWTGGGTLQICGTANISTLQLTENAHIIVTQDGSLTLGSFSAWGSTGTIAVYENAILVINSNFQTAGDRVEIQGVLTVNGNMTVQGLTSSEFVNSGFIDLTGNFQVNNGITINNSGTFNANGIDFFLNNGSTLSNSGTMNIDSDSENNFNINSGSSLSNNGTIDVTGDININAGSIIRNNCALMCSGVFAANSGDFINNSGFLKGAQEFNINNNNRIELIDGSMISTENLTMNSGNILGSGGLNSVYVSGTFTINSNNLVNGAIEAATDDLQISTGTLGDHFVNGATVVGLDAITNYIEATACNPDGIGDSVMLDSDGDGVIDELDDYPNDYYRAFNNYFPSEDGVASLVFEDLWPGTGDYDFNDLVVAVYGNEITSASNDIVEIDINFDVKAVGAALQNGFGWQFAGIRSDQIEQVSGAVLRSGGNISLNANATEQGQDSAVIIVVENIEDVINRAGGSMFNTLNNGLVGTSDLIEMNILFGETSPIDRDLLGPQAYNIFLIKNQNRNTEIHLPNRVPTNLMATELFGTSQDVSDPATGIYFKTATHLPWALLILDDFNYPLEATPIVEAYPNFAAWAQSGGVSNPDWYENPDPSKIWTP